MSNDYFSGINFDKSWNERDWERFFDAQERMVRDYYNAARPYRPKGEVDPALSFRQVMKQFGMDPDNPNAEPQPFQKNAEPSRNAVVHPRLRFWQDGADFETVAVYCEARRYAYRVLSLVGKKFSRILSKSFKSRAHLALQAVLFDWQMAAPKIPRLIAKGHSLGYDPQGAKGNIVRCKKALEQIEHCVTLLSKFPRRFLTQEEYNGFFQETVQLRNSLRDWVDTLRDRFAAAARRPER